MTATTDPRSHEQPSAVGELIRARDWAATPIGPADRWSPSLRTALSICLESRFPILIWWGPEFVMLYNDAYAPLIGSKHPAALGQPFATRTSFQAGARSGGATKARARARKANGRRRASRGRKAASKGRGKRRAS